MKVLDPIAALTTEQARDIAKLTRQLRAERSRANAAEAELAARRAVDAWLREDTTRRCLTITPCGMPTASVLAQSAAGIHTFAADYSSLAATLARRGK